MEEAMKVLLRNAIENFSIACGFRLKNREEFIEQNARLFEEMYAFMIVRQSLLFRLVQRNTRNKKIRHDTATRIVSMRGILDEQYGPQYSVTNIANDACTLSNMSHNLKISMHHARGIKSLCKMMVYEEDGLSMLHMIKDYDLIECPSYVNMASITMMLYKQIFPLVLCAWRWMLKSVDKNDEKTQKRKKTK